MTKLLSAKQLAETLGVSLMTIIRHTYPRGPLPCVRVGKLVRYDPEEVMKVLKELREKKPEKESTGVLVK